MVNSSRIWRISASLNWVHIRLDCKDQQENQAKFQDIFHFLIIYFYQVVLLLNILYIKAISQIKMSQIAEILKAYTFNPSKPALQVQHLLVFDAESRESGLKFTIKLYKRSDSDLAAYFQKIKSAGSQYVIKIYEIYHEPETNQILVIQEAVPYGSLAKALHKCKRLEEDDAVYFSKFLLNGHIDLLRAGVYWTGTQNDIEVTESGIKLSWNNSMTYSTNNENPFPAIIEKLGNKTDVANTILPFFPNKMLTDLIKVSKENASEMSLHPLLKKKEKVFKKKGKNWLALKESKAKGEYVQDLSYLAVSAEHGFVRVKVFEKGLVDFELIKICQTKPSFVKIYDYYEEADSFITVSQYCNDGNVQSYVKRLKSSNIQLKQNHIEFIFFSLIEPLKFINSSPVQSLNMLHIKNIWLENGVPKIGEPVPMSQTLIETLQDKSDIPDFCHKEFKQQPTSKNARFDTYSLGVLLYKLMYTEYPIFPDNSVHIPTTPSYKKTLKDALMLFLNKGGNLSDLEKEIQVSEDVKKQVKENQQQLKNLVQGKQQLDLIDANSEKVQQVQSQISLHEANEGDDNDMKCTRRLCKFIANRGKDTSGKYSHLYLSQFAAYRKCVTIVVILSLYFFAFFLFYMIGFFNLISNTRLFSPIKVTVLGQSHTIISGSYDAFQTAFSSYSDSSTNLNTLNGTMGCLLDDKGSYYDFLKPTSPHWYIYLAISFIAMMVIFILKGMQLSQFNLIKTGYHHYDQTIDGANSSRFALSSYIYFQLWFCLSLYAFFQMFNLIFLEQHMPCFGGNNWSSLTQSLMTDRLDFTLRFLIMIVGVFLFTLLSFIQTHSVYNKIPYGLICNPIFIYTPFYLGFIVAMRIGAYPAFSPSFLTNTNGLIGSSYINTIGYFPEILLLLEIPLIWLIDTIFHKCMDKKLENFVIQQNFSEELRLDK